MSAKPAAYRLIERTPVAYDPDLCGNGELPRWVQSLDATVLRKTRINCNLTLRDAAHLLDMDPLTLGEIERGKLVPEDTNAWSDWGCALRSGAKMFERS